MHHRVVTPADNRLAGAGRTISMLLAGAGAMTLAAKLQVPFWPVPMTLHTLAVMAFALCLGPRVAVSIFVTYLLAGAAGLPVFSGTPERGIGLAYMMGPTGGYLAGYLAASWLTGTLALESGTLGRVGAMLAGLAVIYAMGAARLSAFVPAGDVVALGVAPFLLGDVVKIAVVAAGGMILPAAIARLSSLRR